VLNIQLICNGLKNKAYYIFGKWDMKKDDHGVGAEMRPGTLYATIWVQK
jgi:hypothetical protein